MISRVKMLRHPGDALLAEPLAQLGIECQRTQAFGKPEVIVGLNEHTGVSHHFVDGATSGCQHRAAGRHRFDQRDAELLQHRASGDAGRTNTSASRWMSGSRE